MAYPAIRQPYIERQLKGIYSIWNSAKSEGLEQTESTVSFQAFQSNQAIIFYLFQSLDKTEAA